MLGKSTNSEKTIEHTLVELVKANGGLCIKLVPMFFAGLPDRLILMPNKQICFVETKSTGFKAEKLQRLVHKMIRNLGFDVHMADSIETVKMIVNSLK
jgi:hypothetical protein